MAHRVCPWWVGYLLASPLRRLFQKPEEIVGPHLEPGDTVLDVGCAMGFFSLPMAERVGEGGRVVCVDVQERMIRSLERRAARAGLADRIDARVCAADGLGVADLAGRVDFALAFAMVHEVPDAAGLLAQLQEVLAPRGRLLIAEPRGHVSEAAFEESVAFARKTGLEVAERPSIVKSHAALLSRPR